MNTEQEYAGLLPCPFCGSVEPKLFGEHAPEWWVCCQDCRAATQTRTNKGQAIEDWNRRAALQSQDREDARPERVGIYAWVDGSTTALVLVDKRPSAHAPGGQFNGHVIDSVRFYNGCPVTEWGVGRWVLLHDFDHARRIEGGER